MRTYTTVAIPARTEEQVNKISCDLCGTRIYPYSNEVDLATVKLEIGYRYAEGGEGTTTEYDICSECFKTQLVPFLEGRGAKPVMGGWDF